MRRAAFLFLLSFSLLTWASWAYAGHKCMPAAGLSDLAGNASCTGSGAPIACCTGSGTGNCATAAINNANSGSGRKYTTRDFTDAQNGAVYEFTWPEGGITSADLAAYTLGQDATGNVNWTYQCICVTPGNAEEYAAPTFTAAVSITDADIAAGDLNKALFTSANALNATNCGTLSALDKCIVVFSRGTSSDTDTNTQPLKELCVEW